MSESLFGKRQNIVKHYIDVLVGVDLPMDDPCAITD